MLRLTPWMEKPECTAAWNENSFAICAFDENIEKLKEIADFWNQKDMAIMIGASHAFKNGGLIIKKASTISKKEKDEMYFKDYSQFKLYEAAEKTKIAEKLKKAGKGYYALSPVWKNEYDFGKDKVSKYDVMFILNPEDQQHNNFGWFTVEELEEWISGTGPIQKTA